MFGCDCCFVSRRWGKLVKQSSRWQNLNHRRTPCRRFSQKTCHHPSAMPVGRKDSVNLRRPLGLLLIKVVAGVLNHNLMSWFGSPRISHTGSHVNSARRSFDISIPPRLHWLVKLPAENNIVHGSVATECLVNSNVTEEKTLRLTKYSPE